MKRKAISMILIVLTSVFVVLSVGCSGGGGSDGSSPAGISGSAN